MTKLCQHLFFVLLIWSFSIPAMAIVECGLTSKDIEENLMLSWEQFDQTLGEGHRKWAEEGCFTDAATLIDIYILHNQDDLQPRQNQILYFHSGQTYAYALSNNIAAKRMLKSTNPNEEANPELNWNDYVMASIAFMENKYKDLVIYRDRLAAGKPSQGNKMNLGVVDALIKCFGKPYSWAFEKSECR